MINDIKLRFWSVDHKIWINVWKATFNADGSILDVTDLIGNDLEDNTYYSHNIIISRFTGLLDKNGRKIFEGDILKNITVDLVYADVDYIENPRIGKIYWSEGDAGFALDWGDHATFSFLTPSSYEIIGNIFENPELLRNK